MTDREKVIKGLAGIIDYFYDIYRNDTDSYKCEKAQEYSDVAIDALALLKEKEPKQVIGIADSIEGMEVSYCPSCDRAIVNKKIDETKFCKFCGQAVKWN